LAIVLKSATVDRFRGINTEQQFIFNPSVTLLFGKNGKGKTSLLQAIEWALTGEIPSFKGPDFSKEDAIVNLFAKKKSAKVTLELNDSKEGSEKKIVERTRKQSKSSSTTKTNTSLKLNIGSKDYIGDEALARIEGAVGIELDDLAKSIYIRQDSIHELLKEKPDEMTRGLDKILGTEHVRAFLDAINMKRQIAISKKNLDLRINGIESDKIAVAKSLKKESDKIKERLITSGLKESELTLASSAHKMDKIVRKASEFNKLFGINIIGIFNPKNVDISKLRQFTEQFAEELDEVDQVRQELHSAKNGEISLITNSVASLGSLRKGLSQYEGVDIGKLEEQHSALLQRLTDINSERDSLTSKISSYAVEIRNIENATKDYNTSIAELEQFEEKDQNKLLDRRIELDAELAKIKQTKIQYEADAEKADRVSRKLSNLSIDLRNVIGDMRQHGVSIDTDQNQYAKNIEQNLLVAKEELRTISESQRKFSSIIPMLTTLQHSFQASKRMVSELDLKIESSVQKYGKLDIRSNILDQENKKLTDIKLEIKSFGIYEKLVQQAIEYIQNTNNALCPICERPTDPDQLITLLQSKVKDDIRRKIDLLKAEEQKVSGVIKQLNQDTLDTNNNIKLLEQERSKLNEIVTKLSTLLGKTVDINFDFAKTTMELTEESKQNGEKLLDVQTTVNQQQTLYDNITTLINRRTKDEDEMVKYFAEESLTTTGNITLPIVDQCQIIITEQEAARNEANTQVKVLQEQTIAVNKKLSDMNNIIRSLENVISKINTSSKKIAFLFARSEFTPDLTYSAQDRIDDDEAAIKAARASDKELEQENVTASSSRDKIAADLNNIKGLLEGKSEIENKLQILVDSKRVDSDLIEDANKKVVMLQTETEKYGGNGEHATNIKKIKSEVANLSNGILAYLIQDQKANGMLEEADSLSKLRDKLEAKKNELEILEGSLAAISEVATKYLESEVDQLIREHSKQIDDIYNKIVAHPVFQHIKLDIQKRDPLTYSIKVTDDAGTIDTSASTRFSTAQMNSFAISVLVANNLRLNPSLSLLMMDDPTQSMDSDHKKTLSKLIADTSRKRQIIIATSDEEFKEYLNKYCKDAISNIEFSDWTEQGPVIAVS